VQDSVELYEVGEQVGLTVQFGTEAQPFDPPRVLFRVRDPRGKVAELTYGKDPSLVRSRPGSYQVIVTVSRPGRWHYQFVGIGRGSRTGHEGFFEVMDVSLP
jgi:hypothetical protein